MKPAEIKTTPDALAKLLNGPEFGLWLDYLELRRKEVQVNVNDCTKQGIEHEQERGYLRCLDSLLSGEMTKECIEQAISEYQSKLDTEQSEKDATELETLYQKILTVLQKLFDRGRNLWE